MHIHVGPSSFEDQISHSATSHPFVKSGRILRDFQYVEQDSIIRVPKTDKDRPFRSAGNVEVAYWTPLDILYNSYISTIVYRYLYCII